MISIKIFLASSNELESERDKFASLINQLNRIYKPRGVELELVLWEYLNSSVGRKRKQDEYNEEIKDCEICIAIFWTQLGKYTKEEFQLAYDGLNAGRNPQRLYVFFKEPANPTDELQRFKDSFEYDYGHFYSIFENTDTLRLQFLLQLEIFKNDSIDFSKLIHIEDSTLSIGGISFVNLKNVPFVANNDNYVLLQQQIEKQRMRLIKHPDEIEEQRELHTLLNRRQEMENNMLSLARKLNEQTQHEMSPRMIEARKLFEMGEFQAVIKILDTKDIFSDINSSKVKIELYNSKRKQEEANIDLSINEVQLRIKTEGVLLEKGWVLKIISEYKLLIEETRNYASPFSFAKLLLEAARFIEEHSPEITIISLYNECIEIMEHMVELNEKELTIYGDMLYYAGHFFSKDVYEIDNDPTIGEWMDAKKEKIHATVMKRWEEYRKQAKKHLIKSVEIFESLNKYNKYDEDIYCSLRSLTNCIIWDEDVKGMMSSYKKLISFARNSTLSNEYLLSALCSYATSLIYKDDGKELNNILDECESISMKIKPSLLPPQTLIDISFIFEMRNDYKQAGLFCRRALKRCEELSEKDPYIYQNRIADCFELLAKYVHLDTGGYKINPESFHMLDRAESIYENLYNATGSYAFSRKISHIQNLKFEYRLSERLNFGEHVFNSVCNELKEFLSSHITNGKHNYNINIKDSPIKNIGIWIKKIRNKNEYKLLFTWEIDEWSVSDCSMGPFYGGTKEEIYQYLISMDCYKRLKECIIKDLYKSWNI